MSILESYHGTTKGVAERFIKEKIVQFSKCGDSNSPRFRDLWLGDGFYLFEEAFYSFKWITEHAYNNRKSDFNINLVKDNYNIISVKINYNKNRSFDLRNMEHKYIFDHTLSRITTSLIPNYNVPQNSIPDGVVINYLFEFLNYKNKYDIVCAPYFLNVTNYRNFTKSKLKGVFQLQYCLKSTEIIDSISLFKYDEYLDDYIDMWKTLFPGSKPFGETTKSIYTRDREEINYES